MKANVYVEVPNTYYRQELLNRIEEEAQEICVCPDEIRRATATLGLRAEACRQQVGRYFTQRKRNIEDRGQKQVKYVK